MRAVLMMLVLALALAGAAEGKAEKGRSIPALPEHAKGHGLAPVEHDAAPAPEPVDERPSRGPTRTFRASTSSLPADVTSPSPPAPPVPEQIVDARLGDGTTLMAQDVTIVQPAGGDGGAPWLRALWAIPLAALGALGIVLVARREKRPHLTDPPAAVPALLLAGQEAVARAELEKAIACFDRALALSPGLAVALFCKGACLAEVGRLAEAYETLKAATIADPGDGGALVHLARVALALGRPAEAMDALEPIASAAPEIGEAMMQDPKLAGLRDHPRFLMMCGAL